METIQFLTKDQINGLLIILEKDYILPKINDKLNIIKESDKYKTNYNIIEDTFKKCDNLYKKLDELKINIYHSFSITEKAISDKTIESLGIRDVYNIKNRILDDLKSRLQLIIPSDFDSIIKNIIKYIDVDKYLYKEKQQVTVSEEDENNDNLYD